MRISDWSSDVCSADLRHRDLQGRPGCVCRQYPGAERRVSGHEDDPAADGIEEGKRLIRLGGEKGLSLAERLQDRFHRLTWRTPIHTLRLRGRYPLKLIAVPEDPFFGDVARGNALLAGKLRFRGEERAIDTLDLARPDVSAD